MFFCFFLKHSASWSFLNTWLFFEFLHQNLYVLSKEENHFVGSPLSFLKRSLSCFFIFLQRFRFLGFLIKLSMFHQKGKTIRCFSLL